MKFIVKSIFPLLALLVITMSCKSTSDSKEYSDNDICGSWTCAVNDSITSGTEIITFCSDKTFDLSDSLRFVFNDKGFKAQLDFTVKVKGKWTIDDNNNINVKYDSGSIAVAPIAGSFNVISTEDNADDELLNSIKEQMEGDLAKELSDIYTSQYKVIAENEIGLGTVLHVDRNTIEIGNNGVNLKLKRL